MLDAEPAGIMHVKYIHVLVSEALQRSEFDRLDGCEFRYVIHDARFLELLTIKPGFHGVCAVLHCYTVHSVHTRNSLLRASDLGPQLKEQVTRSLVPFPLSQNRDGSYEQDMY